MYNSNYLQALLMKYSNVLQINISDLINQSLSIQNYLFCWFLLYPDRFDFGKYVKKNGLFKIKDLDILVDDGWITKKEDNYLLGNFSVTDKFRKFVQYDNPEEWINEWYDKWPKGIKTGLYLIRTDKAGCLKKMKTFLKLNPDFHKDIIMEATDNYLRTMKLGGWSYTRLAPFFIEKQGTSVLSGECENVINKKEVRKIDKNEGIFEREIKPTSDRSA